MAKENEEVVLLVHGTFAQHEPGTEPKWWEIGSKTWQEIEKRLPAGARLAERREVFDWSGMNQERDRYQAGVDLLSRRLLKLERDGRPYHLIGHSHGGSVIWHALQEAVRRRIGRKRSDPRLQLPLLRSWTTVGTPFLQYAESPMGRWPGAIVAKLFFLVSWGLTLFLGFVLIEYLIERFFPDSNNTNLESMLFDAGQLETLVPVAAVCALAMAIAAIPGLALHVWVSAIRREALAVRQTALVRNHAMLEFGNRWLGLWSQQDEAISLLKSTVKLRMQLLPKLQLRTSRVFQYDRRLWSYRFLLRWLLAPILNTTFVPAGNNMILTSVTKSAQGDDRPGCRIVSVSEGPVCFQDRYPYPSLPEPVDRMLIDSANQHLEKKAPTFVPKIRAFLADFSSGVALLDGATRNAGFEFDGDEMVHTSYFDNAHVLDLLAFHVRAQQQNGPSVKPGKGGLEKWYQATRQNVRQNVVTNKYIKEKSLSRLAKNNRSAKWSIVLGIAALSCLPLALFFDDRYQPWIGGSIVCGLLGLIFGRMGQLAAERGARYRRFAAFGVNLGLIWLVITLPIVIGLALEYFGLY